MAIIQPIIKSIGPAGAVKQVSWTLLATGEVGAPFLLQRWATTSFQIVGNAPTALAINGSNDSPDAGVTNMSPLSDWQGPWITPGWENFLNNLPDEFYSFKDKVVVDLINLTVVIQKTDRDDARNISSGLMIVNDLPENLKSTIYGNDAAYNKNAKPSNYGWVVGVGVVVLKLLVFSGGWTTLILQHQSPPFHFICKSFILKMKIIICF